ncbi:MAG: hypothetical protein RBU21_08205, partial [FCB group bacterium]|nr:hypothetical protein [FCB group bacterium]
VEADGFFQESLTGAYSGMFPRTVGGLVSLFLETDELDLCERLIDCTLTATRENGMERVPHVLDRRQAPDPVSDGNDLVQPRHELPYYRLDGDFCAVQTFKAPAQPIHAIEVYLKLLNCTGKLVLSVSQDRDGEPIRTQTVDAQEAARKGRWTRFAFDPPLLLTPGALYCFRMSYEGEGKPFWYGLTSSGHRLAGTYAFDASASPPQWLDHPDHVSTFAFDTGGLTRKRVSTYPILSDRDEIDGQAHILMAFGRLAQRRGPTPFEEEWYPFVAKLLDRTVDWPNVLTGGWPADLGLVRNVSLEHSREGRMWDTYDILTQSFVGAALESMIDVARRRNDLEHATHWQGRLEALRAAVAKHMVRQLDGKTVYLEMRLPDSGAGVPFGGMGWLNFAPVAAQWEPLEPQVLRDTVQALRRRALFDWEGHKALALDWNADGTFTKSVIGKGIGWEIDYSRREGEWDRIGEWLDFLEAMHTAPIYMESATLDANGQWSAGDPGNGEQCTWWCWSIARLRKEVGLPARP